MSQTDKINLDEFDDIGGLPRPLQVLLKAFRSEFRDFLSRRIRKMDLVTKEEFLVQKRLLEQAYQEIEKLKKDVK